MPRDGLFMLGMTCFFPSASGPRTRGIMFTHRSRRSGRTARGLVLADTTLRETLWRTLIVPADSSCQSRECIFVFRQKPLGVLGLGRIGSQVARVGSAFGMNLIAWSQNMTPE